MKYGKDSIKLPRNAAGRAVAIQRKCNDRGHRVSKHDVDSFISVSDIRLDEGSVFALKGGVSTCPWNSNADNAIRHKCPKSAASLMAAPAAVLGLETDEMVVWRETLWLPSWPLPTRSPASAGR